MSDEQARPGRRAPWWPIRGADALRAGLLGLLVASYAAGVFLATIIAALIAAIALDSGGGARYFDRPPAWLTALALAAIGATIVPVVRWLKAGVDDVVYGADDDTAAVLARLNAVLEAAGETAPPALSRRDEARLADLARRLGTVVFAARLTHDVRAARERLVAAREEERRRIRNDLHDGLGPTLSALLLQLDALERLVRQPDVAPARLDGALDALRATVRGATADIRRLVEGLRPPALDALGLVGAVRQLGEADGGAAFTIEAPDLPSLPAAVEVAGYRIAAEALHNVRRHAPGARCVVRFALETGALRLEVVDDGPGFASDRPNGIGTASMAERAAELRGTLVLDRAPGGGARVVARLPLALDPPPADVAGAPWTP